MSYQITAYVLDAECTEGQNSILSTMRILATRATTPDAIETARQLLPKYTEVTIWNDRPDTGKILTDWLPQKTIILSEPRWLGTAPAVDAWFSGNSNLPYPVIVDRHFHEYTASDGRKVNFAFESPCNVEPQVPKFVTREAIERFEQQLSQISRRRLSSRIASNGLPPDVCRRPKG